MRSTEKGNILVARSKGAQGRVVSLSARLAVGLLILAGLTAAQPAAETDRVKAMAVCVRQLVQRVQANFPRPIRRTDNEFVEMLGKHVAAIDEAKLAGFRKCLTQEEVYQLGWFSFLEDSTTQCPVSRTSSFGERRSDDLDLVNAAASWEKLEGDINQLTFFRGQADARAHYRSLARETVAKAICAGLVDGFGPTGDRLPGLVSAPSSDSEMRSLFAAYQKFKNSSEFRRFGYALVGPFNAWSARMQALSADAGYAGVLLSRCGVVPMDLWLAGTTAYKGQTDNHRTEVERKFAACFARK
jgi:hypothetical protein